MAVYSNANSNFASGRDLPTTPWAEGLMFYLDSENDDQGLYISSGNAWFKLGGGNFAQPVNKAPIRGAVTLVNGTALVNAAGFGADSLVTLSYQTITGTPGILSITNEHPGVGFDIISTSSSDNSKVVFQITEATPSTFAEDHYI